MKLKLNRKKIKQRKKIFKIRSTIHFDKFININQVNSPKIK